MKRKASSSNSQIPRERHSEYGIMLVLEAVEKPFSPKHQKEEIR